MKKALVSLVLLCSFARIAAAREARTVIVFPFDNLSARSDLNWVSESFPEMLSSRMTSGANYVLGREERNAAYTQLELPPGAPLTLASEYKVAETLGVDWAVLGSFNVEGERLTIRAQLLDLRRLKLKPLVELTGELAELVDLQTELVWRLLAANDSRFAVGTEEDFQRQFPEVRLDAFENYVRGILVADEEKKIRFLREADRLDPSNHKAAFELGRYYFDQKDYTNSAYWLRKLSPIDSHYQEALFRLSVDEYFLGQLGEAEKGFAALATQVALNEVWNNLGALKARRGAYLDAQEDFNRARQGDPGDADFSFNLGACLWYLKRYKEAAGRVEEALRVDDDDPGLHALLAASLGQLGDADGQRREAQWLDDHEGGSMASEGFQPQFRMKKNYDGRAFRLLSVAVSNEVEQQLSGQSAAVHGGVHLARGKTFLAENRWSEAEPELLEAVSLMPESSEGRLALGELYESEGRHIDAARELEASLKLQDSVSAHLWLARAFLSLGKTEAARSQSQAALELDPSNKHATQLMDQIRAQLKVRGGTR